MSPSHESDSELPNITFTVTHNKQTQKHCVAPAISLQQFCSEVLLLPNPPSDPTSSTTDHFYKLITKGRTIQLPGPSSEASLAALGFLEGSKVLVVTSTAAAVASLEAEGDYERRRAAARASSKTVKVRDTSGRSTNPYRFGRIVPLPLSPIAPFEAERMAMLKRLSDDPAVRQIMKEMEFTVEILGELHPNIDPTLLGVNENAGQRIRLRLLTDRLDGLRSYNMVRRVAIHELTHNKFGPHDDDFKTLDSQLTRRVAALEAAARTSGHRLGGELGDHYEPPEQIEAACSTSAETPAGETRAGAMPDRAGVVLGGGDNRERAGGTQDMRRAAAEAAMKRAEESKRR